MLTVDLDDIFSTAKDGLFNALRHFFFVLGYKLVNGVLHIPSCMFDIKNLLFNSVKGDVL